MIDKSIYYIFLCVYWDKDNRPVSPAEVVDVRVSVLSEELSAETCLHGWTDRSWAGLFSFWH